MECIAIHCSALQFDVTEFNCAMRHNSHCDALQLTLRCIAKSPSQAILHSDEKHPPSLHLMATLCERRAELRQCEACLRSEPPPRALHRHPLQRRLCVRRLGFRLSAQCAC